MTDSRVSRGSLQALVQSTPNARVSRGGVQALGRPAPDARVSRGGVQVLHRPPDTEAWISQGSLQALVITVPIVFVRSVESADAVKMKQPDGLWWPMEAKG